MVLDLEMQPSMKPVHPGRAIHVDRPLDMHRGPRLAHVTRGQTLVRPVEHGHGIVIDTDLKVNNACYRMGKADIEKSFGCRGKRCNQTAKPHKVQETAKKIEQTMTSVVAQDKRMALLFQPPTELSEYVYMTLRMKIDAAQHKHDRKERPVLMAHQPFRYHLQGLTGSA